MQSLRDCYVATYYAFCCDPSSSSSIWCCSHNLRKRAPRNRVSHVCELQSCYCQRTCNHIHRRHILVLSDHVSACVYSKIVLCGQKTRICHTETFFLLNACPCVFPFVLCQMFCSHRGCSEISFPSHVPLQGVSSECKVLVTCKDTNHN